MIRLCQSVAAQLHRELHGLLQELSQNRHRARQIGPRSQRRLHQDTPGWYSPANSVPRIRPKATAPGRLPKSARSPAVGPISHWRRLPCRLCFGLPSTGCEVSAPAPWLAARVPAQRSAGRPDCARRDPGRQSTARLHPSPRRAFHGGQDAARPAHHALRF